jgi:hypothetical protein
MSSAGVSKAIRQFIYLHIYSSTALVGLARCFSFLTYTQTVKGKAATYTQNNTNKE